MPAITGGSPRSSRADDDTDSVDEHSDDFSDPLEDPDIIAWLVPDGTNQTMPYGDPDG